MKLSEKVLAEMLAVYADEESFRFVVNMAVSKTIKECASLVQSYSEHRIPASEYSTRLLEDTKIDRYELL